MVEVYYQVYVRNREGEWWGVFNPIYDYRDAVKKYNELLELWDRVKLVQFKTVDTVIDEYGRDD